jgi:hypothetical protein
MHNEINVVHWLQHFSGYLPLLGLIFLLIIFISITAKFILRLFSLRYLLAQPVTYLELTPPAFLDKPPQATDEFYAVLHSLGFKQSALDKLLKRETVFALEIMASLELGIRFLVRIPKSHTDSFIEAVHAYMRDVQVKEIESYLTGQLDDNAIVASFKQRQHWGHKLKDHRGLENTDPLSYVTTAMTKLAPGEIIVLQDLVTSAREPEADTIRRKILRNEDISEHLSKRSLTIAPTILHGIRSVLFGLLDAIGEIHHGHSNYNYSTANQDSYQKHLVAMGVRPARMLSSFEQKHLESVQQKVSEPLFRADLRVLIVTASNETSLRRLQSIESAMASYAVAGYQSLGSKKSGLPWFKRYNQFLFMNRLPVVHHKRSNLLSISEIASLYHFPHSKTAQTENVVKSLSKTLPAPISLKDGTKLDILVGINRHHGSSTPIGLTAAERERHIYIIGGTGSGKTTTLLYAVTQDINNGKGVAIVDPHGDLAESVLRHIPEERIDDVIYFNPDDLSYPIGLNLLELTEGLTGDDLLREKDLVTESVISVFRKMFSDDDSGGHRIEYILRNCIQTALTIEGATLFTIFDLLNNTKFRKDVVRNLEDEDLKNFWRNEIGKAGSFQKVKMAAGITAKIGRFLFSASAKRILEQPKSTIDFDEILNSGKILVCNLSKGMLGEDTSTLFGTTILAKLQVAALRRARLRQSDRQPFYLYVDEFQNFATMAFVQMLSEARKYKLFLTMAEQSTSQQEYQRLVDIILANVGTVMCFRSGSPADERFILPIFSPYIKEGEIANLPAYSFYIRMSAVQPQEPLSGVTVVLDNPGSEAIAQQVIATSRTNNAIDYGAVVMARATKKPKEPTAIANSTKTYQQSGTSQQAPDRQTTRIPRTNTKIKKVKETVTTSK